MEAEGGCYGNDDCTAQGKGLRAVEEGLGLLTRGRGGSLKLEVLRELSSARNPSRIGCGQPSAQLAMLCAKSAHRMTRCVRDGCVASSSYPAHLVTKLS